MVKHLIRDFYEAIKILWFVISVIIVIFFLITLINSEDTLKISSFLKLGHDANELCIFCGMTRAFIQILKGNLLQAEEFNSGAIPLLTILLLNSLVFLIATYHKFTQKEKR